MTQVTAYTTGSTPWRPQGIKHKVNQVYLDVIESVNLLVSTTGSVLRADVSGKIVLNSELSGTPECTFGMNDKVLMNNEMKKGKRYFFSPLPYLTHIE